MNELCKNGDIRPVVYLETWVHQNYTHLRQSSEITGGLCIPTGEFNHLIVFHARYHYFGFIKTTKLLFSMQLQ